MKHVIYSIEFYSGNGTFLREEEIDAYFNTIPEDSSGSQEKVPPIGCRLLQPKLVPSRLTKEQWEHLCAKKPDYILRYASLYDVDENQYAIYAIYERMIEGESEEVYSLNVSIGKDNEVCLFLLVQPVDYDLGDCHLTRWDAVSYEGTTLVQTDDCVNITSNKKVTIFYKDFTIEGKWLSMEQISKHEFVYHCKNSLFPFDITINIERC